jgi:hypothetical protein
VRQGIVQSVEEVEVDRKVILAFIDKSGNSIETVEPNVSTVIALSIKSPPPEMAAAVMITLCCYKNNSLFTLNEVMNMHISDYNRCAKTLMNYFDNINKGP